MFAKTDLHKIELYYASMCAEFCRDSHKGCIPCKLSDGHDTALIDHDSNMNNIQHISSLNLQQL